MCAIPESIPVVIPCKRESRRLPFKNHLLLPHTLDLIQRMGLSRQTIVVSDCPAILAMAESTGAMPLWERRTVGMEDSILRCAAQAAEIRPAAPAVLILPVVFPMREAAWLDAVWKALSPGGRVGGEDAPQVAATAHRDADSSGFFIDAESGKSLDCPHCAPVRFRFLEAVIACTREALSNPLLLRDIRHWHDAHRVAYAHVPRPEFPAVETHRDMEAFLTAWAAKSRG